MRRRLATAALAAIVLAHAVFAPSQAARAGDTQVAHILDFDALDGWAGDDHDAALSVFQDTCDRMRGPEWRKLCALAKQAKPDISARAFFELFFKPVLIEDGAEPHFTGYFEPELRGSRNRTAQFRYPVYKKPRDLVSGQSYLSRREISNGALANRGLEIAWVADPVELFFLHVQGSGRIRLDTGQTIRIGYAGKNGHTYRSIGKELVRRGVYNEHQVSAQVIKNWVRRNPVDGQELLNFNASYVFFKELDRLAADKGPIGALNRSITTMRSIAIDPRYTPLGAPVWIEKDGAAPLRRLMIAQDTGAAIKGAQRADIFYGTGEKAGEKAGRINDTGRMITLIPIQIAHDLVERLAL